MCSFSLDSHKCAKCCSFPDCLDEAIPALVATVADEPRTDAPLKIIVTHCRTRKHREGKSHV